MGSRQDIDALLISALYGELTPAEETRLAAHLETHPTDRTALDDLTRAREIVRESRLFEVQLEPPPAMSALLLQEAARRAPRAASDGAQQGWVARFLRSFMAHPAMAAAAMLVVVVGVATMVTKRSGDHFAESSAPAASGQADSTLALERSPSAAAPQPDPGASAMGSAAVATSEAYRVGLDDGFGYADGEVGKLAADQAAAGGNAEEQAATGRASGRRDLARQELALQTPAPRPAPAKGANKEAGIELRKPEPSPKDLDAAPRRAPATEQRFEAKADAVAVEGNRGPTGGAPSGSTVGGYASAPPASPGAGKPSPPPPPQLAAPREAPTATKKTVARAPAPAQDKAADPLISWAREQHGVLIAQVRAGRCTDAGRLAVTIADRAPSYYEQNVATDRSVKDCSAYIVAERQKVQQERARRAKASDAKRADEPAKRAAEQPSKPTTTDAKPTTTDAK